MALKSNQLNGLFSSNTDQWSTPQDFFDKLNDEFHFTLDPCADHSNHKCDLYFTVEDDGLSKNWGGTERSAIPLTGKRSLSGSKRHIRRAKSQIRLLLC